MRIHLPILFLCFSLLASCKKRSDPEPTPQPASYTLYGSDWSTYYALDASTGIKRWEFKSGHMPTGVPKVYKGLVYCSDDKRALYALDAATGQKRWEFLHGTLALTIENDVIYMIGQNGKVYALDPLTGAKRWEAPFGIWDSFQLHFPIITNGVVYVCTSNKKYYSLDAATGAVKSTIIDTSLHPARPFQVQNGLLYITNYHERKVKVYDFITETIRWEYELDDPIGYSSNPIHANQTMYIANNHRLHALNAITGQKKWEFNTGAYPFDAAPTLANGILYCVAGTKLYGIDAATGQKVQESLLPTRGPFYSSPIVENGVVYLSEFDSMCALELGSGKVKWHLKTDRMDPFNYPVLANGLLYRINSNTSQFYAVDIQTGVIKWESLAVNPIVISQIAVGKDWTR